jgi:hypothetical protein
MKRQISIAVLVSVLALLPVFAEAEQNKRNSGFGTLTAFEDRNTKAVISDLGYMLSSKVLIYDKFGRKATVEELELPAPVYFEFFYAPQGVVITLLKVTPR